MGSWGRLVGGWRRFFWADVDISFSMANRTRKRETASITKGDMLRFPAVKVCGLAGR